MIPLIITNYNQLTYLKNLINWWHWYNPKNRVLIVDNGSDYEPLLEYYEALTGVDNYTHVFNYKENNAADNLVDFIKRVDWNYDEYYCISDPDIMPHPATPANFLDIFKHAIDEMGFHHAGFGLITEDLPIWATEKEKILLNEDEQLRIYDPIKFEFEGSELTGFKAPLDTTFTMFKSEKGWYPAMSAEDWKSSFRVLKAFHLPWYIDGKRVNEEMKNYYNTCKYKDGSPISSGKNNYRPK